ncbi:hypothetical protein BJX63DRAFT_285036 [Aspergillus granulosus]|uniref:BZIP domain-containing protein n=1 Tax=Aspergillus granulosus TaxID=176169 RepID=A0ABR4H6Y8_9EURO
MYCQSSHNTSFYVGDSDQQAAHWDTSSVYFKGEIPLLPASGTDDLLSFSSASLTSSPHMSELSVGDSHPAPINEDELPDDEFKEPSTKLNTRRLQNRQAQRRFRERKEQQKTAILTRLEDLQSKHDRMASLITSLKQENRALEIDKIRLKREADVLRKWRQKLLSLMSDLVRQDEMANDQLTTIARSCSDTCWRRGVEYSRLLITMQTLLSLFEELQIAPEGG